MREPKQWMGVILSVSFLAAMTVTAEPGPAGKKGGGRFGQIDTNGDGAVDIDEFSAGQSERMAGRFERMDEDGDGSLSAAEFERVTSSPRYEKMVQKLEKRGKTPPSFGDMDGNADGVVTLEEWADAHTQGAEARFEKLDTDGDGSLTREELGKGHPGRKGKKGPGRKGGPPPEFDEGV